MLSSHSRYVDVVSRSRQSFNRGLVCINYITLHSWLNHLYGQLQVFERLYCTVQKYTSIMIVVGDCIYLLNCNGHWFLWIVRVCLVALTRYRRVHVGYFKRSWNSAVAVVILTFCLIEQTCGWKSRFLSGDVHLVNVFLSHWQADVLLNEEILKVTCHLCSCYPLFTLIELN